MSKREIDRYRLEKEESGRTRGGGRRVREKVKEGHGNEGERDVWGKPNKQEEMCRGKVWKHCVSKPCAPSRMWESRHV